MLLEIAGMVASAVVLLVPAQSPICNVQFPNDGRFHPAVCSIGLSTQPSLHIERHRHHSNHYSHLRWHNMGRLVTR